MSDSDNNYNNEIYREGRFVPPPIQYIYVTQEPSGSGSDNSESSVPEKKIGFALTSMIVGIVAAVFSCIPTISLICGGVGLTFGTITLVKHKDGSRMAFAGVICSSLAIHIAICILLVIVALDIPLIQKIIDDLLWYLRQ